MVSRFVASLRKAIRTMGKNFKLRPEVEPLESMMLLSGMTAALPNPLALQGTEHGTFQLKGTNSVSKASGSITPLGQVRDTGSVSHVTGLGNVTMTSKEGKLYVDLKMMPSASGYEGTYTIVGGTKSLANETGSGTVQVAVTSTGKHGTFSITYG
jgi:hypothetical protein